MSQTPYNPADGRWHLRKELNVGHLLTTMTLTAGLIGWGNALSGRVTAVETEITHIKQTQAIQREDALRMQSDMISELRAIRSRIDEMAQKLP